MVEISAATTGAIVPERCYRDAREAIAFLEQAFGFTPSLVVLADDDQAIVHAELWAGRACLMLGSISDEKVWRYRTPGQLGGVNTGSAYLATPAIDAFYARAVAAGCTIASGLIESEYGSRDFSALDAEGFLWHVGTYSPTSAGEPAAAARTEDPELFCGLRYADARTALAWLSKAFGAVEQVVIAGEGAAVAHAQMLLGDGLFMLGSGRNDRYNLKTPLQIGGDYTQSLNVYVADPDAHYAQALSAGADILSPLADTPYGARGYVVRDCEGYVWGFSTYRPAPPALIERPSSFV